MTHSAKCTCSPAQKLEKRQVYIRDIRVELPLQEGASYLTCEVPLRNEPSLHVDTDFSQCQLFSASSRSRRSSSARASARAASASFPSLR